MTKNKIKKLSKGVACVALSCCLIICKTGIVSADETKTATVKKKNAAFYIVESPGIPFVELVDVEGNYREDYYSNKAGDKIYSNRSISAYSIVTGNYAPVSLSVANPVHHNLSTDATTTFKWSDASAIFPTCTQCLYRTNTTRKRYTKSDNGKMVGKSTIMLYCQGALVPTQVFKMSMTLK